MTLEVQSLEPWHAYNLDIQDSQAGILDPADAENSPGFALVDTDNEEVFCIFMLIPAVTDPDRISAFTAFSRHLGARRLLFAAREARRWLEKWGQFRRCEAYCPEHAVDEIHWCRYVLKMELEGKLHSFFVDGQACYVFAKVK